MNEWEEFAACRSEDPSLFEVPDYVGNMKRQMVKATKRKLEAGMKICATCSVTGPCWASANDADKHFTVRGGNPPQIFINLTHKSAA